MAQPRTVAEILEIIDSATEPTVMNKGQALETLEQIEAELQGRMEALRDEMRAAGQELG